MNDISTLKRIKKRVNKLNADCCMLGRHSLDFVDADTLCEPWADNPVLFVFDDGAAGKLDCGETPLPFTEAFTRNAYGEAARTAIMLFRLSNAFVMSLAAGGELSVAALDNSLYKIAEALSQDFKDELLIFAFGQRAADTASEYLYAKNKARGKDDKKIRFRLCPLPLPSAAMGDENRKYVLFGKMYKFLTSADVDCSAAAADFLGTDSAARNRAANFGNAASALSSAFKKHADIPHLVVKTKRVRRFIKSANVLTEAVYEQNPVVGKRLTQITCFCKNFDCDALKGVSFGFNADSQDFFAFDYTAGEYLTCDALLARGDEIAKLYCVFADFVEGKLK